MQPEGDSFDPRPDLDLVEPLFAGSWGAEAAEGRTAEEEAASGGGGPSRPPRARADGLHDRHQPRGQRHVRALVHARASPGARRHAGRAPAVDHHVTAVAGVFTVVPAFEAIEMVFGLGSIVWFIGAGVTLSEKLVFGKVKSAHKGVVQCFLTCKDIQRGKGEEELEALVAVVVLLVTTLL